MKPDPESSDFAKMTQYLSEEATWHALDGMACVFHNQGYSLEANTPENDALWLAKALRQTLDHYAPWETASDERKAELLAIAEASIKCLPDFCQRISRRYIDLSKAIRTMEIVKRKQVEKIRREIKD